MSNQRVLYSIASETPSELVLRLIDPKMTKGQRMDIALQIPDEIYNIYNMTSEEFSSFAYTKAVSQQSVYLLSGLGKNEVRTPLAEWLSAETTKKIPGLWDLMVEYRELIAEKSFYEFLLGAQTKIHKALRGNAIDLTMSIMPTHGPGGIHLSSTALKACYPGNEQNKEKLERCVRILGQIEELALQNTFDDETRTLYKTLFEERRIAEASITNGHPMTNGIQLNSFSLENCIQSNTAAITGRGEAHADRNDDPVRRCVILFLESNVPDGFYPGIFNLTAARWSCVAEEFSILTMNARSPHLSSGRGIIDPTEPVDSVRRLHNTAGVPKLAGEQYVKARYHTIMYCRQDAARARRIEINKDMLTKEKGLLQYGGDETKWREWIMLMGVKCDIDAIRAKAKQGKITTPEMLIEKYKWFDERTQTWHYPPLSSAKICLEQAGTENREYNKIRKAALWPDCGSRMPREAEDDNSPEAVKKRHQRAYKERKKQGKLATQCRFLVKRSSGWELCKKRGFGSKCALHLKIERAGKRSRILKANANAGTDEGSMEFVSE